MAGAFDALGGGKAADTTGTANSINATWTHTASGADRAVVAAISVVSDVSTATTASFTRTVTYGGVSMTSLGEIQPNNTTVGMFLEFFGLLSPATGAQTVSVTVARASTNIGFGGNSLSYTGVGSFGTVTAAGGTEAGTSVSQTVTGSATGHRVVQGFNARQTSNLASYNQSTRFSIAGTGWTSSMIVGDATGAASIPFTASGRTSGADYSKLAVDLIDGTQAVPATGNFFLFL